MSVNISSNLVFGPLTWLYNLGWAAMCSGMVKGGKIRVKMKVLIIVGLQP